MAEISCKGDKIQLCNIRAPMLVFVLSRTQRSEPYFFSSRSVRTSSRLRTALMSSSINSLDCSKEICVMFFSECICVSLRYDKSAPAAETAANCPSRRNGERFFTPNCSSRFFSAFSALNSLSRYTEKSGRTLCLISELAP